MNVQVIDTELRSDWAAAIAVNHERRRLELNEHWWHGWQSMRQQVKWQPVTCCCVVWWARLARTPWRTVLVRQLIAWCSWLVYSLSHDELSSIGVIRVAESGKSGRQRRESEERKRGEEKGKMHHIEKYTMWPGVKDDTVEVWTDAHPLLWYLSGDCLVMSRSRSEVERCNKWRRKMRDTSYASFLFSCHFNSWRTRQYNEYVREERRREERREMRWMTGRENVREREGGQLSSLFLSSLSQGDRYSKLAGQESERRREKKSYWPIEDATTSLATDDCLYKRIFPLTHLFTLYARAQDRRGRLCHRASLAAAEKATRRRRRRRQVESTFFILFYCPSSHLLQKDDNCHHFKQYCSISSHHCNIINLSQPWRVSTSLNSEVQEAKKVSSKTRRHSKRPE